MTASSRRIAGAFTAGVLTATAIAMALTTPWSVGAAPGDDDTTFVPITACRLVDTRPAPNRVGTQGTFSSADAKTFQATGSNGECVGIPNDAVGLSMNVTALGASQLSFLTFWAGGDRPLAASLNPAPGEPPTPNAVTTELSATGSFNVYNESGSVDIVIDVNGYYTSTSLSSLQDQIDALRNDVTALQGGQQQLVDGTPFVETTTAAKVEIPNTFDLIEVIDLSVTAPADGRITVWASANVSETYAGGITSCAISDDDFVTTPNSRSFVAPSNFTSGGIDTVRVFDVLAGETLDLAFGCGRFAASGGEADIFSPIMSALFTPSS